VIDTAKAIFTDNAMRVVHEINAERLPGMGDKAAENALFSLVYDELRKIAARSMGRERGDHTLQTTALVHEALVGLPAY